MYNLNSIFQTKANNFTFEYKNKKHFINKRIIITKMISCQKEQKSKT
ncbi:hypothetical protein bcgnr5391_50480 [Bacillus cereus]